MPEVRNNIDMTSGNLGLTDGEEIDIVAFLPTLSDGFTRSYINSRSLGSGKIRIIVNCAARAPATRVARPRRRSQLLVPILRLILGR